MNDLIPIALLLVVVGFVVTRLPKVELGFSDAFRRRRVANWLPLGLSYAFLYMARYNLNAVKTIHVLSEHSYGTIYAVGAACYGISFFVNGPLTDRFGGRRAILLATSGSGLMNLLMGLAARSGQIGNEHVGLFEVLFGLNMYFQSFGACAIIKVNSAWFHVRERGVFGGIFGILISLGLYFAFDWCLGIAKACAIEWVFLVPSAICFTFFAICFLVVRATPADAGHADFDTADASSNESGGRLPVTEVLRRMLTNKVVMTIAFIEFCSGFLRDSIMHWYRDFAGALGGGEAFVAKNWGMLLCVAGIMGGTFAGILSDRFFDSRRPPVAAVLYTIMLVGALALLAAIAFPVVSGWVVIAMVMSVIGVHGVLSGTASADFGGKKNAGVATGIIDGFVYAGTATQSYILGRALPEKGTALAALPESWRVWPIAMLPIAGLGLFLATRVWNAKPKPKEAPAPPVGPSVMGHPEGVSKAARRGSRETQAKILDQVLALAQSAGKDGVVAFDLDSTLLDNRTRQALLLREWATRRGGPEAITRTKPEHLDGWDLRVAMVNAGLPRAEAEAVYADAKNFWRERFFTSEYCKLDVPIAGAVAYVEKLRATGVQIVYLTGRHEAMRAGTVESFVTAGFPVPDDKTIRLFMKPTLEQDDDAWKVEAKARLRPLGKILAAFDNEPIHINGYKESFPDTFAVHLDTDSSGRPVAVLESIPSVLDFLS